MKQMLFVLTSATWASANLATQPFGDNLLAGPLLICGGELAISLIGFAQYLSSVTSFPDVETFPDAET